MSDYQLNRRFAGERGEGNGKFIGVMVVLAIVGFCVYSVMPIYYKEQQLRHDVKEEVRIGAINNQDIPTVEKKIKKHIDDIDFPQPIKVKSTRKGDNLTVACTGTVPISFI